MYIVLIRNGDVVGPFKNATAAWEYVYDNCPRVERVWSIREAGSLWAEVKVLKNPT